MDSKNVIHATTVGPVPKQTRPKMVVKTFRVSERLWGAVVEKCQENEENPSDVIRRALEEYVDDSGGDGGVVVVPLPPADGA